MDFRNMTKSRFLRILRVFVSCIAVGFLSNFAWRAFQEIPKPDLLQARWGLLAALLIACVYRVANSFGWGMVIRSLGYPISACQSARIWIMSESMRWLPGSIWNLASRASQARKLGVSIEVAALSLPLEYGLTILAWGGIAILSGVFTGTLGVAFEAVPVWALWMIGMVPLIVAGVLARTRRYRLSAIIRRICSNSAADESRGRRVQGLLLVFGLYSALCVLHGAGLAVILGSFLDEPPSLWVIVAANAVSWLVGFMIPLAPSGIGVREGALCLALGHAVPIEITALAAILWRLAQIVSELMIIAPVGVYHMMESRTSSDKSKEQSS